MKEIDINCDMGESFWSKKVGHDELIMQFISSANVACGFHGGDPTTISKTISSALEHQVAVGAHPSFWDLEGFGRREFEMSKSDLKTILLYQISALKGMVEAQGGKLNHVKPHGALYNMAARTRSYSEALIEVIMAIDPNLKLYGLPNSLTHQVASEKGVSFIPEAFSDRAYNRDGTLVGRSQSGSTLEDEILITERMLKLIETDILQTINGESLELQVSTICIHGDGRNALKIARSLHSGLKDAGIQILAQ